MKKLITLVLAAIGLAQVRAENVCVVNTITESCTRALSVSLQPIEGLPSYICLSGPISVSTTTNFTTALKLFTTNYVNPAQCPAATRTVEFGPTISNERWEITGAFTALGTGLSASFTPTATGSGTITFSIDVSLASGASPCTYSSQTISISGSFTVASPTADSDYDGVTDCQEGADGTNPLDPNDARQTWLAFFRFPDGAWGGAQGQTPLDSFNVAPVSGWRDNSLRIDSPSPSWLIYRDVETSGLPNELARKGTVRFWFKPNWSSGVGPGQEARLLEIGSSDDAQSDQYLRLLINATGTQISFNTKTNPSANNLNANINWNANQWHQLTLTYSPNNSSLFIDGQPANTSGSGVQYFPNAAYRALGISVGSDKSGNNQARGDFDDFETFNSELSADSIAASHSSTIGPQQQVNSCALYPIALPSSFNAQSSGVNHNLGTAPGNFGWLNWDGGNADAPELATSLTTPNSGNYINPENQVDRVITINDKIMGDTGLSASDAVKTALNNLISSTTIMTLPRCDLVNGDVHGSHVKYTVRSYVNVRLTAYSFQGNPKWLRFNYVSDANCDGTQNTPPTILPIADQTINEDTDTGEIPVTVGDQESPVGSLTLSAAVSGSTLPTTPSVTFNGSGANRTIKVIPAADEYGSATITVTVSDGQASTPEPFTLTVTPVNDPPTISPIADRTINEDTDTGEIPVTVGDQESPVGSLTLSAAVSGSTLPTTPNVIFGGFGANRTVKVIPAANEYGSATITVTVSDGQASTPEPFTLTVNPVNDPPTISPIADRTINEDTDTGEIPFTVADQETPVSSLTLSAAVSGSTLPTTPNVVFGGSGANRTVKVIPAANEYGSATITVTVSDGPASTPEVFLLTVSPVNDPPLIALNDQPLIYSAMEAAKPIDDQATVIDVDSPNFNGGRVEVRSNGPVEDRLGIRHQGQIGLSGNSVSYGGVPLGTVSGLNHPTVMDILLSGTAPLVAVEALIRNVTFYNASDRPSTAPRFVNVRLYEADGVNGMDERRVNVIPVINAPPIADAGPDRLIAPAPIPPATDVKAFLSGTVTDDGFPVGNMVTLTWTEDASNPVADVALAHDPAFPNDTPANQAKYIATFNSSVVPGTYKFKLEASDGTLTERDEMIVTVVDLRGRTFTRNVDFEQGSLLNVNYDEMPDQLQLNKKITPYPYVNIACSGRGTVARIDVNNGQVVGEYLTAPEPRSPSRTTVDKYGNVWVANRSEDPQGKGSVARIGLIIGGTRGIKDPPEVSTGYTFTPDPNGQWLAPPYIYNTCLDQDDDRLIRTSKELGNVLAWGSDEAVTLYTVDGTGVRTIAIDKDNNVWIGGHGNGIHQKLDVATGTLTTKFTTGSGGAYGGLIDGNGFLWSVIVYSSITRYNTAASPPSSPTVPASGSYGIGIDPITGKIWYSQYGGYEVHAVSPDGSLNLGYDVGSSGGRGLAVDGDGNVWIALSSHRVCHFRTDGTRVGYIELPCGSQSIGVAVDLNGNVWIANGNGKAYRINPNGGPGGGGGFKIGYVDMIVDLDEVRYMGWSASPYNYSDMTGFVSLGSTSPSGAWTIIHDSGSDDTAWGSLTWTAVEFPVQEARLVVETRAGTGATVDQVEFFEATSTPVSLGVQTTPSGGTYSLTLNMPPGSYEIKAVASAHRNSNPAEQWITESPFPFLQLNVGPRLRDNDPPVALGDTYIVWGKSANNELKVTVNDDDPNDDPFVIVDAPPVTSRGEITISPDGKSLTYTPIIWAFASEFGLVNIIWPINGDDPCSCLEEPSLAAMFGEDSFFYTIQDSKGGRARALVKVTVMYNSPPSVAITTVDNGLNPPPANQSIPFEHVNVPVVITSAAASGSGRTISKLELFADTQKVGEVLVPASPYTFVWNHVPSGPHYLRAKATDSAGDFAYSAPVTVIKQPKPNNAYPVALLSTPSEGLKPGSANWPDPEARIALPVVQGKITPQGIANDADGTDTVYYRFFLYRADGTALGPVGSEVEDRVGTLPSTSEAFAELDLTRFPDGMYQLELVVWDGWDSTTERVRIVLRNPLMIGRSTFTQEDVIISEVGLPLTVVRTYDSYNPYSGDFGYSWTYSLADMNVEIDEFRSDFEDYFDSEPFSMRIGGGRDVTLTLPDGRRTTFTYRLDGPRTYDTGIQAYDAVWDAEPGVTATLTTLDPGVPGVGGNPGSPGDNTILPVPWPHWAKGHVGVPLENYDFPGFKLTLDDGTVYDIKRENLDIRAAEVEPGHFIYPHAYGNAGVSNIVERNGTTIRITRDGIVKTDFNGVDTIAVLFRRDSVGRITAIFDPASLNAAGNPVGFPTVEYRYGDGKGNLTDVSKLTDRPTGSYETTTFVYNEANFPHYISQIIDPRGIAPVINHFDSQGRLSGITDAESHTTTFVRAGLVPSGIAPTAVGVEKIVDHWGNETIQEFDARGNVVLTINALGHKIKHEFDSGNDRLTAEEIRGTGNPGTLLARTEHAYTYHDPVEQTKILTLTIRQLKVVAGAIIAGQEITTINEFDQFGQVVKTTDAKGAYVSNTYDQKGNLTRTEHFSIADTSLQVAFRSMYYNDPLDVEDPNPADDAPFEGLLEWTKDALDNKTIYFYYNGTEPESGGTWGRSKKVEQRDASGNLLSLSSNTYDANGNVKTESRARNNETDLNITEYFYDAQNRVERTEDPEGGEVRAIYNSIDQVASSVDRYGNPTTFIYNPKGEVIQTTYSDGAVTRTATIYGYGASNKRKAVVTEERHFATDPVFGTRTEYDEVNRVVQTERLENLVITVQPVGQSFISQFVSAAIVSTTSTAYDDAGRAQSTTDARGNTTSYTYDGYGRRETVTVWATTPTARERTVTTSQYDVNGNLEGTTMVLTRFTLADPPVQIGSPVVVPTPDFQYDDLNRQWLTVHPDNSYSRVIHDALGRAVEEIDQEGISARFDYDGAGRLVTVTQPYKLYDPTDLNDYQNPAVTDANPADKTITRYGYDLAGSLIRQTDANQTVITPESAQKHTTFEYDRLGRRTKRKLPLDQEETWIHDAMVGSQLVPRITHTDFNATVIVQEFDEMGRLETETPTSATLLPEGKVPLALTYTATGRRKTMTDASGVTEYQYDNRDRLWTKTVEKATPHQRILTYLYDANDNVTSISSSTSETLLSYDYDELNRLKSGNSTAYTYDAAGNLKTATYPSPNSAVSTYNYNSLNRLTYMTVKNGSDQLLASFDYDDGDSTDGLTWLPQRRLSRTGQRQGAAEVIKYSGPEYRRLVAYDYDPLHRVRAERIRTSSGAAWPSWAPVAVPPTPANGDVLYDVTAGYSDLPSHGYDRVSNRRSRRVSDSALTSRGVTDFSGQTFDANDRLTGGINQHDANGNTRVGELLNLSGIVAPTASTQDEYDYENRLIKRFDASTSIWVVYDGDGNRVRKTIITGSGTTTIRYLVDDRNPTGYAQVLEEWKTDSGGTTLERAYTYGHDLVSQRKSGTTHYYGYDGHGNVRVLLNSTGGISDAYSYDAFGVLIHDWHAAAPTPNHYLYCGEQWDSDLGMYFLRARYVNPATGRFWTADNFEGAPEDPFSLHKYLYAHANPVNNLDPSGHYTLTEALVVVGKIATVASFIYSGIAVAKKIANGKITEITIWDLLGFVPGGGAAFGKGAAALAKFGYGAFVAKGMNTAWGHKVAAGLYTLGSQMATAAGKAKYTKALGTQFHNYVKSSWLGRGFKKVRDWGARFGLDVRVDQSIGSGPGSRPDFTILIRRAGVAVAIDIKPVPKHVWEQGFVACYNHLHNESIGGRREGTLRILARDGYNPRRTWYLYLPYPSFSTFQP